MPVAATGSRTSMRSPAPREAASGTTFDAWHKPHHTTLLSPTLDRLSAARARELDRDRSSLLLFVSEWARQWLSAVVMPSGGPPFTCARGHRAAGAVAGLQAGGLLASLCREAPPTIGGGADLVPRCVPSRLDRRGARPASTLPAATGAHCRSRRTCATLARRASRSLRSLASRSSCCANGSSP